MANQRELLDKGNFDRLLEQLDLPFAETNKELLEDLDDKVAKLLKNHPQENSAFKMKKARDKMAQQIESKREEYKKMDKKILQELSYSLDFLKLRTETTDLGENLLLVVKLDHEEEVVGGFGIDTDNSDFLSLRKEELAEKITSLVSQAMKNYLLSEIDRIVKENKE